LEVIPIDTSKYKFIFTDTLDDTTTQEDVTQDVHQTTEEAPLEPWVTKVTKETPLVKIASFHHPHHQARQQSFSKEGGHQQCYGPRWKQRGS